MIPHNKCPICEEILSKIPKVDENDPDINLETWIKLEIGKSLKEELEKLHQEGE